MSSDSSAYELNKSIYDSHYAQVDESQVYEPFLELLADLVKKHEFRTIADFGCGSGKFGYYLKKYLPGFDGVVDGIDISKKGLEQAAPHYSNTYLIKDNHLPDKTYDFVVLNSIIEHLLPEDLDVLFEEIKIKLAEQGALFIVVPNPNGLSYVLGGKKKVLAEEYHTKGHVNMKNQRELKAFLRGHGFFKLQFSFFFNFQDIAKFNCTEPGTQSLVFRLFYRFLPVFPLYHLKSSFWILARRA